MKIRFIFAWFDLFMGLYWNQKKRRLYILPLPTIGFYIQFGEPARPKFRVIDLKTGRKPDLVLIATEEDWAKHLMWMDMAGFAIDEDGDLILMDECDNIANCPEGRFRIEWK